MDATDGACRTALCLAAKHGHVQIIEALITAGADINHRNDQGRTPLHYAARNRQVESTQALMRLGADPNVADTGGYTPYSYAKTKGYSSITSILTQDRESE